LPSSANHISTSAVNNWNMYGTGVASEHRAFRPPQQEETETVCNQWRGAGKTRCPIPATGESGDFVWLKRNSGTPRGVSRARLKHGLSEKTLRGNKREEGYMNAGTANVSIPVRRRRRKWGKSEWGVHVSHAASKTFQSHPSRGGLAEYARGNTRHHLAVGGCTAPVCGIEHRSVIKKILASRGSSASGTREERSLECGRQFPTGVRCNGKKRWFE